MNFRSRFLSILLLSLTCLGLIACKGSSGSSKQRTLLNVSYDPTRELYGEINPLFGALWKEKTGEEVKFRQSHGGGGKQARAVIDGLEADVVTLAIAYDMDEIHARAGLIPKDWQSRLPDNSTPYTSTIVLLVRKGNPKNIRDWEDLAREGVQVITPNPKTSGGARWNYLAAWGYALKKWDGNEEKARELLNRIFKNVPVLDSGARGATTTFVERGIGDVLIAWENEALLTVHKLKSNDFELVAPSVSILTEPPVTVVDQYARKHGTEELARAYLEYLYTPEAQRIVAKHFYRPRDAQALEEYKAQFPSMELITVDADLGGWTAAHKKHFADGGLFDQIYSAGK